MAEQQMRPASREQAPNPAHTYERAEPNREANAPKGKTRPSTPESPPDEIKENVPNKPDPKKRKA